MRRLQRCSLCRARFPISELTEELVWQSPPAGSYSLVWRSDRVCATCREANRDGSPAAQAELRDRLREPCRTWLTRAPDIDPGGWPVQPETIELETAVEQCLDAFFWTPGRQFDFEAHLDRLPESHEGVLYKRDPDPFAEQVLSFYDGSIFRTPDGRIYFDWRFRYSA